MSIYANAGASPYNYPVEILWERLIPRLDLVRNSVNFVDSCQEVIELITERLWFRKSDILRQDITFTVTQSEDELILPAEFLAIAAEPFLIDSNNKARLLTNIHETRRYDYLGQEAQPRFYYFNLSTVTIFPAANKTYTVHIPCHIKPAPLTSISDTLPFQGIFNQLIGDSAVKISNVGLGLLSDPTFVASLYEKVDKMVNLRNNKNIYFQQSGTGSQYLYNNFTSSSPNYF